MLSYNIVLDSEMHLTWTYFKACGVPISRNSHLGFVGGAAGEPRATLARLARRFKFAFFAKFWRARPRLHRGRFMNENVHFSPFSNSLNPLNQNGYGYLRINMHQVAINAMCSQHSLEIFLTHWRHTVSASHHTKNDQANQNWKFDVHCDCTDNVWTTKS